MANLIEIDGVMALKMNPEDGEVCVVISNGGEIVFLEAYPEDGEQSPQGWLAEGLAAALSDPHLFEELRAIAAKGHDLHWESAEKFH